MSDQAFEDREVNLQVIRTEVKPSGETVQLVRPVVHSTRSSDEIVEELVSRFDYKKNNVNPSGSEVNAMEQAFGNDLANELIESYAGSNLISDSQQDLIGEKYLAEQIKRIQEQQKTSSIMDKWSHLLYEGTKDRPSSTTASTTTTVTATANPKERLSTPLQSVKSAKSNKTTPASTKPPTPTPQRLLSSSSSQQKVSSTAVATEKPQISVISQLPSFQYAAVSPQIKLSSPKPSSRQPSVQKLRKGDSGDGKVTPTTSKPAEIVFEISTPEEVAVEPHNQQQQQQQQPQASEYDYQSATQSQSYLPQFSSSNLNSITIDAYNSPQFRAMLEQLTKPINVPPEQINYPPEWPSQEKIYLLAEPIYIPAPQPIVIPAPNVYTLADYYQPALGQNTIRTDITYYPPLTTSDQSINTELKQLNLGSKK